MGENEQSIPKEKGQNQVIKLCGQLKLEKKTSQLKNKDLTNPKNIKIDLENPTTNDNIISYGFKNEKDETVKDLTISCTKGFEIGNYSDQIKREIFQFNGNVTIHRLESGTVLVRVFGKGQSILSSCWCNAADPTSAVKEAKDLYKRVPAKVGAKKVCYDA